ncbi:MAG: hypothetical protein HYV09_18140 [Deltaproteobacteria bacterium]|nr:hypothetical protein [Deltaproteobacteria bacterium]
MKNRSPKSASRPKNTTAASAERDAKTANIDAPIPYVPAPVRGTAFDALGDVRWTKARRCARALHAAVDVEAERTGDPRVVGMRAGLAVLCEVFDRLARGDDAVVDIGARRDERNRDVVASFRIDFTAEPKLWTPDERRELHEAHCAKQREIFDRRIAAHDAKKKTPAKGAA